MGLSIVNANSTPTTNTLQKVPMSIPFIANKTYGMETWYDDGSGWKKAGAYDGPSCGRDKTYTCPASNAQVEFRLDSSNVTFSGTDAAII